MNSLGPNGKLRRLSPSQDFAVDAEELDLRGRLTAGLDPAMRGPYLVGPHDPALKNNLSDSNGYQRALDQARSRMASYPDFLKPFNALAQGFLVKTFDDAAGAMAGLATAGGNALADRGLGRRRPYSGADMARAGSLAVDEDIRRYRAKHPYAQGLELVGGVLSPGNKLTGGVNRLAGGGFGGALAEGAVGGALEGVADSYGIDRALEGAVGIPGGAFGAGVVDEVKRGLGALAGRAVPPPIRSQIRRLVAEAPGALRYAGEVAGRALDKKSQDLVTQGVRDTINRIHNSYGTPSPGGGNSGLRGPQSLTIPDGLRGPLR